jgi:hypothetical protein
MAGGDGVEAVRLSPLAKDPEFNVTIAHDIGIGGLALLVTLQQVGDDELTIVGHEIDDAKRNPEVIRDGVSVDDVLFPRTVTDDFVFVDPVLHVGRFDLLPRVSDQHRRDSAIDAAGKCDESSWSGAHEWKRGQGRGSCQCRG